MYWRTDRDMIANMYERHSALDCMQTISHQLACCTGHASRDWC
jgi:hypothetical protein